MLPEYNNKHNKVLLYLTDISLYIFITLRNQVQGSEGFWGIKVKIPLPKTGQGNHTVVMGTHLGAPSPGGLLGLAVGRNAFDGKIIF